MRNSACFLHMSIRVTIIRSCDACVGASERWHGSGSVEDGRQRAGSTGDINLFRVVRRAQGKLLQYLQGFGGTETLLSRLRPGDISSDVCAVACTRLPASASSTSGGGSLDHLVSHSTCLPSAALPSAFTCPSPSPSHALLRCISLHGDASSAAPGKASSV